MNPKALNKQPILRRQAGMTTLGLLILVVFIGMFAFAAIRLTPVYLNYLKIVGVVNGVVEEFDTNNPSRSEIVSSISRRFDIESVSELRAKDVQVKPVGNGFEVVATYSHRAPFVANISFVVDFNKSVVVRK
ncbi:MAG: DUF4845 domain-containing protein [Woeseiaceae bacterium]